MKKIAFYTLLCILFSFSSCDLFELDNKEAPAETIQGEVVDVATGEPVLTDQGSEGIRVKMIEVSWGDNVQPNNDFFCMPNGTFQNTKVFKGKYNISVDGPFIPILRADSRGVVLANETKTVDVSGVTKVKFEVQPFLKVEWVSEPTLVNGKIIAKVRVKRAVDESVFKAKIAPMGDYKDEFFNVTDIWLFVSYSASVGFREKDDRWTNHIDYAGNAFNASEGQVITITSNPKFPIPAGHKVFIRAASRINYSTYNQKRFNYNEAKEVIIPQ